MINWMALSQDKRQMDPWVSKAADLISYKNLLVNNKKC